VRQLVTVKFMVWNAADALSRTSPARSKTKSVYTAKQGDTYAKIAARQLKNEGGAKWGNRLAQLNGARDGAAAPKVGQSVKLPTPAEVKKWSQTPRR
jgi:LysM repeat protein